MKRILTSLLLCALLLTGCGQTDSTDQGAPANSGEKPLIVTTIFPAYDLARAVAGDTAEVRLLLPPGAESHSYEPTPADIMSVQDCDLFLYVGGKADSWVDTILDAAAPKGEQLRMVDCVELLDEHDHDHHEHDHTEGTVRETDEHVWTSPVNAIAITQAIGARMEALDPDHQEAYQANTDDYTAQLSEVDQGFRTFFASLEHPVMLFGDRFPLRYFAEEYGVDYYAAFPGCSTQTEPSAATIAFLTDKVRTEGISTVYYIEFSNHLVADSIAEATGAGTAMFHSCHNVSQADMDAGVTYVSLMQQNLETLKATMH